MKKSRIRSESSGRYLLAEIPEKKYEFEEQMILSIAAENLLKPSVVFEEDKAWFSFNITDCMTLEEYLGKKALSEQDICTLMIQLNRVCEVLNGYLLKEGNLLLRSEQVFVDKNDDRLLFCAVPGEEENYIAELHAFMERLVMSVDLTDRAAVTLCVRLFRETAQTDCRMYDLMNEIIQNRKKSGMPEGDGMKTLPEPLKTDPPDGYQPYRPQKKSERENTYAAEPQAVDFTNGLQESPFAERAGRPGKKKEKDKGKPKRTFENKENTAFPQPQPVEQEMDQFFPTESGYKSPLTLQDLGDPEPLEPLAYGDPYETEPADIRYPNDSRSGKEGPSVSFLILKILVSQLLLGGAMTAIYFLKGKILMLRLLPIYGIMTIAVTAFFIVSFVMDQRKTHSINNEKEKDRGFT